MLRPDIRNRSFDRMGERYRHLIDPDHFLGRSSFDIPWDKRHFPSANLRRNGADYVMELAVPGFSKEEIEVLIEGDVLTIRGEKHITEPLPESEAYILEEFNVQSFERSFKLTQRIAHDQLIAHYENGVLFLTFTNVVEKEETPRKVAIT